MKKYNVKIFNKHKLNAVGVGVPDDPFIKQKHINKSTSNIQTSNIKFPTSNAAITLIALIITIIVLLILAGVTLNMVMGESGLFGKANNAKNKTEVAQYEEELRMCVLELQTEEASNGRTFNMDTIRDNLDTYTQKLEDETIEWKEKDIEEPTGIYKGYNFYIDKNYGAHIKDKATGIQISMKILSEIPETGYTNQDVSLKITITNNEKGINKIIKPDGNTESLNGAKTYEEEKTATENTKYTYVVTDTEGKEETKEVEIKIIDKNAPQDFSIEAQVTEEGIQITANPEDAEETETNASSGINKVEYILTNEKNETTTYETNLIKELPSGIYSVYAKSYDKAGNEKQSTNTVTGLKVSAIYKNITAKMVAEHPKLYYGLTVTNYESQNGQNDWKIFYSDWNENPDDAHIFLITGDCVDLAVDGRLNENTKMTMISKYIADWKQKDIPDEMQLVPDETLELFKATEYKLKSKNQNSICVSTLLNSENWQGYLDTNNEKAKEAIGGPTIEMWSLSWNSKYPSDKIYYKADKEGYGYFIGENEDPIKNYSVNNSQKKGYNDVLYNVSLVNSNTKNRIYWISSPSADEDVRLYYNIVGNIASNRNTVNAVGIRPVVSLKKDITVDAKDSE